MSFHHSHRPLVRRCPTAFPGGRIHESDGRIVTFHQANYRYDRPVSANGQHTARELYYLKRRWIRMQGKMRYPSPDYDWFKWGMGLVPYSTRVTLRHTTWHGHVDSVYITGPVGVLP